MKRGRTGAKQAMAMAEGSQRKRDEVGHCCGCRFHCILSCVCVENQNLVASFRFSFPVNVYLNSILVRLCFFFLVLTVSFFVLLTLVTLIYNNLSPVVLKKKRFRSKMKMKIKIFIVFDSIY